MLAPIRVLSSFLLVVGFVPAQARWTRAYPATTPTLRQDSAMTASGDGRVVLYGGRDPNTQAGRLDTWAYDGSVWTQLATGPTNPGIRSGHAMAWHPGRQEIVLFGGDNSPRVDVWLLDSAATWRSISTVNGPANRRWHALATDPVAERVVLFGGEDLLGNLLADVWVWNGTWTRLQTNSGPSPRSSPAMAFDPSTGRMLVFGGSDTLPLDDTWTLAGTTWQRHTPATPPYPRATHGMVSDLARRRVVLFGGHVSDPWTWEWDGSEWQAMWLAGPAPRYRPGMAYDPIGRRVVLHGGANSVHHMVDTWSHATPTPAMFTVYGSGCDNGAFAPRLTNAPYSLPWLGETFRTHLRVFHPAAVGAFFVTGLARTAPQSLTRLGLPVGCDSHTTAETARFVPIVGGIAEWSLVVPNTIALLGSSIRQQGLVLDPTIPGGAVVSNAGETVTGMR